MTMTTKQVRFVDQVREKALQFPPSLPVFNDYFSVVAHQQNVQDAIRFSEDARAAATFLLQNQHKTKATTSSILDFMELQKRGLLLAAPYDFDSYMRYIEWDRDPKKRFYTPRRNQLLPIARSLQDLADDKLDLLSISLPPGVGKALANDTPILTRNGWKNHGDLQVGDEVIGLNGEFKKVIAVHPKCMLDRLVTFTNGEQIVCHARHEWMVMNRNRSTEKIFTEETQEIEKYPLAKGTPGKRGHRYMFTLPHHAHVKGEDKDLPLDPYTFGVWLGDGTNKTPLICNPFGDRDIIAKILSTTDIPLLRYFEHGVTGCLYWAFDMRSQLQSMGMCHSRKTTVKHIPDCYLTASIKQRLELLAGLLDTDGCLVNNKYQFSTTEAALRDSFVSLISTFGWRACITEREPRTSSAGIAGKKLCYTIGFTPDLEIPCALQRKQNHNPKPQRSISIESIEHIAPVEGNCITVEGDGMYLAGKTMLPTHNTTLAIFYITWLAGRQPDKPILTGSHSNAFIRGVYDECLRILDPNGEYLWKDVFPLTQISGTNAKDCRIDLGKRKRFETLEFTSIGTGNAGLYRAVQLLYCDDLVSGLEVALSKDRLDKLWDTYRTDLRQREMSGCKELHIATRWSVHDVIGRLQEQYENSERARFIVIPALNEADESNFDYLYGVGFSTKDYHDQRDIMDEVSWLALYMNQPIEREGLLYHQNELQRYFELPTKEPDAILAVCDTKDRGADYCAMPIAYQYGQQFFIEEFICDNANPDVVEAKLVEVLLKHHVHSARFESNAAGGRIAQKVQEETTKRGGRTKIVTKYTTSNKETRIINAAGYVKEHFLFRDSSALPASTHPYHKDYETAMRFLSTYSMAGRNKHDDVPDALAMLVDFIDAQYVGGVEIFRRPV